MSNDTQDTKGNVPFYLNPRAIIAAVVVALLLLTWLVVSTIQRNVDNDGARLQRDIKTLSVNVGTTLSNCLDESRIASQITQQQYASVKDILLAAVSARYVDDNGNATRASNTLGGQAFGAVLQENYPQVDLSTWKSFMSTAIGCREDVTDDQKRLQISAGNFDVWRTQGDLVTHGVRAKFPTADLTVYDATRHQEVSGLDALNYLTRTIRTSEAQKAIDTGVMPDQQLGSSPTPTK